MPPSAEEPKPEPAAADEEAPAKDKKDAKEGDKAADKADAAKEPAKGH
jgi:hypothetical protein